MKRTSFSQFRNNASAFFDAVEDGESIAIYRHGRLVGIFSPAEESTMKRWKSSHPVRLGRNIALSKAILNERSED